MAKLTNQREVLLTNLLNKPEILLEKSQKLNTDFTITILRSKDIKQENCTLNEEHLSANTCTNKNSLNFFHS